MTSPTQGEHARPKGAAADGKTELFNIPGYPLMVRAVDFNRLHAQVAAITTSQPVAQQGAAGVLTNQQIIDRFDFLEGLVSECTFNQITDAAKKIHAHALRTQQPAPALGLPVTQEPKYTVDGAHIVNRATGEAVPHDEPVFVFRARDALGVRALEAYLELIGEREPSSAHADAVRGRIADFQRFAASHPERMKWPDTSPTPQVDSQPVPVLDYPPLPDADIVVTDVGQAWSYAGNRDVKGELFYTAARMRAYVDADRAARAPADSRRAPVLNEAFECARAALNHCQDRASIAHILDTLRARVDKAVLATPPAQAADSVLEDAAPSVEATAKTLAWLELPMHVRQTMRIRAEATLAAARKQGASHD